MASLRWVLRHRAYTPWYLVRYARFAVFKLRNPHIVTTGMVFLDRGVEITARRGYARVVLGRWLHLGANTALRCHEGTLTVGDKSVLGANDDADFSGLFTPTYGADGAGTMGSSGPKISSCITVMSSLTFSSRLWAMRRAWPCSYSGIRVAPLSVASLV